MQRSFVLERYFARHEQVLEVMLSSSDCEPLTLRQLLELSGGSLDSLLDLRLAYTDARGAPRLRQAISAQHPGTSAEDVLVVNAPQEAILLAMQAMVRPGDRVVVQTPCYQSLRDVALELGAEVVPWPIAPDGAGFALDLDKLEACLRQKTALVVTNFPHNPTGVSPTQDVFTELTFLIENSGARWFSDEMYRGLGRDDHAELAPAASEIAGAVSLGGLSKSLNLPGLRLGWLVCRDRALLAEIERRKDWTSICSNAVSELAGEHALGIAPLLYQQNRARIAQNEAKLEAFLAERPGALSWSRPHAGPVSLARVERGTATELADRARERARALLVPSNMFGLEDRWVRLGLGRDAMDVALARLAIALEA